MSKNNLYLFLSEFFQFKLNRYLLLAAFGIRLFFVFAIPGGHEVLNGLQGMNDEPSHLNYIQYLTQYHCFPVQEHSVRDPGAFERNDFEYHQPPLYYLIGSVTSLNGSNTLGVRLLSFSFGIVFLIALLYLLYQINVNTKVLTGALIFFGFSINHIYHSSIVSNDSISWLWCILVLIALANKSLWLKPLFSKEFWTLSLLLGIGTLIKGSLLLFFPLIGVSAILAWYHDHNPKILLNCLLILCVAGLIGSPWYIRNFIVYGSLTNLDLANGPQQRFLFESHTLIRFLKSATATFWFPPTNIADHIGRSLLNATGAGIILTCSTLTILYWKRWSKQNNFYWVLLTLFIINMAAYIKYNLYWTNSDGRFLFPSAAFLAIVFCQSTFNLLNHPRFVRWYLIIIGMITLYPYLYFLITLPYIL